MSGLPRTIDIGSYWGDSLNVNMALGKCHLTFQMSHMDYSSLNEAQVETTGNTGKLMASHAHGQVWKLYDYENLMVFEDMISRNALKIDTTIYYKYCNVHLSLYKKNRDDYF